MSRIAVRPSPSFWYLASPYSKYHAGLQSAYDVALDATVLLTHAGHCVYSPIVHTHQIAGRGNFDPLDHELWLALDKPFVDAACGIIVLLAPGWNESKGVKWERERFQSAGKPEWYMAPGHLPDILP